MNTLSKSALRKAEEFVRSQARPLEQALLANFLHDAAADWALDELAVFQNRDGGFGHGLEPDLQFQGSTVLATSVALQHLRSLDAEEEHPLVRGAMRFLLDTYDSDMQAWPFVSPAIIDTPRAPWWQYDPDLSGYLANPRAELIGYLFDYPQLNPPELRQSLLVSAIEYLENSPGELEMHELLCYRRLVETKNLADGAKEHLLTLLRPLVETAVVTDPNAWESYGLQPLQMAPAPESPFAQQLQESIELNLDFEIAQQQDDGSWSPSWSWGEAVPDAWTHAKRAWQGVLTVDSIKTLSAYGRLA